MKNIAVLISGRGSNLQALIDAEKNKIFNGVISIVISNNPKAQGIRRAEEAGKLVRILDHKNYSTRGAHEEKIIETLNLYKIDLVVLAGYTRILTKKLISEYPNKIINIHPALLPSFPGLNAQEQALNYGVKITGCTTHFVNEEMDNGPIIFQKSVLISQDDNEQTLVERILKEEHQLLVRTVKFFCENKFEIKGRKVFVK